MSKPEPINQILKNVIKDASERSVSFENQLALDWEEIIGKHLHDRIRPLRFDFGVLYLVTDHPSVSQEFRIRYSRSVLDRINKRFGDGKVKKIIVHIG